MLAMLKRLFFGDDRLFLSGSHLARAIRNEEFHGIEDIGETSIPNTCWLVMDYERCGRVQFHVEERP